MLEIVLSFGTVLVQYIYVRVFVTRVKSVALAILRFMPENKISVLLFENFNFLLL